MDRTSLPIQIQTDRLLLRPFTFTDVNDVFAYATDENWSEFLPVPDPYTFANAETFICICKIRDLNKEIAWALEYEKTVIGALEFRFKADDQTVGEMHWSIAHFHWGKGLTPEAAGAVRDAIFSNYKNLHRIYDRADTENRGSTRVMEKIGMKHEGILRQHMHIKEKWVDLAHYAILRPEWEKIVASKK